jgi:excisionase family DNA binding protein
MMEGGVLKPLLTISELSMYLKVSKPTLYVWIREKKIPHIRLNERVIRFDTQKIDAFMEKHAV